MAYLDKYMLIRDASHEIMQSQRDLDGWSDRIMAAILAPTKVPNINKYPLGHSIPFRTGPKPQMNFKHDGIGNREY